MGRVGFSFDEFMRRARFTRVATYHVKTGGMALNTHLIIIGGIVAIAVAAMGWLAANQTPIPEPLTYIVTAGFGAITGMEIQKRSN